MLAFGPAPIYAGPLFFASLPWSAAPLLLSLPVLFFRSSAIPSCASPYSRSLIPRFTVFFPSCPTPSFFLGARRGAFRSRPWNPSVCGVAFVRPVYCGGGLCFFAFPFDPRVVPPPNLSLTGCVPFSPHVYFFPLPCLPCTHLPFRLSSTGTMGPSPHFLMLLFIASRPSLSSLGTLRPVLLTAVCSGRIVGILPLIFLRPRPHPLLFGSFVLGYPSPISSHSSPLRSPRRFPSFDLRFLRWWPPVSLTSLRHVSIFDFFHRNPPLRHSLFFHPAFLPFFCLQLGCFCS